ncbi:unnamed protein product [Boreogadus saida]
MDYARDKHCLLELSLANVQGLLKQGVYPIVIHIQPKNKKIRCNKQQQQWQQQRGCVNYKSYGEAVVRNAKWKINNLMDGRRRSRDAEIIVAEALQLVGSEPHYHLFFNNCEHFATELRYGISRSRQAVIGLIHVPLNPAAAIAVFAGLAIVGLGWLGSEAMKKVADKAKLKSKLKHHR